MYYSIIVIFLVALCFIFYKYYFLRKPNRNINDSSNVFVSPATGKIINIFSSQDIELPIYKNNKKALDTMTHDIEGPYTVISIMLTIFDVHYQRASYEGKITYQQYRKGRFLNAVYGTSNGKSTFENENNQILIQTPQGFTYKIIQIAGLMARKIESYVGIGQMVEKGEIIGLIKLGSQVTIILDKNVKITAKIGQKVIDGETIIGVLD